MILATARFARFAFVCCVVVGLLSGCGDASGPRASVQGAVTYDDQPVDEGGIAFFPEGDGEGAVERPRVTGEIRDGRYDLDNHRGPHPGKYRVELYWQKKTGKQVAGEGGRPKDEVKQALPPKYNTASDLKAEIKPGSNTVDFHLAR